MQRYFGMVIAKYIDQAEVLCRRCLMNIIPRTTIAVIAIFMLALPVVAGGTTPTQLSFVDVNPAVAQDKDPKTKALALKRLDFEHFAKTKVQQLNRNLVFSRARMKITKQSDGTYRGRYHQIDDSTLKMKVSRSQSKAIPYVGILSYREQVFESTASTREGLDQGSFAVVEVIPNRHLFSYRKGVWN